METKRRRNNTVAVIGGGASGMAAAISAAWAGACVTVYERNDRLGKKILSTGNGRCNLGNLSLRAEDYHSDDMELVERCLARFGTGQTCDFFRRLGLLLKDRDGCLYPYSEQASAVLDVLRAEVERAGVQVVYCACVRKVYRRKGGDFLLSLEGKDGPEESVYDRVILACGGKAAPKTGSDGSGYELAKSLGLAVTPVVPALVQLCCSEEYCRAVAGVRAHARVYIEDGRQCIASEEGEVQLTEYGISGIPVFQLSGRVNLYRQENHKKSLTARIDFLPEYDRVSWDRYVKERMEMLPERAMEPAETFFSGILHKKLMLLFMRLSRIRAAAVTGETDREKLLAVFGLCRNFALHVTGSHSFDSAQVCAGGVSAGEISDSMEALRVRGLYLAGEMLNVDGRCGGYNLHWAWASGCLAGYAAAQGKGSLEGRKEALRNRGSNAQDQSDKNTDNAGKRRGHERS